MLRHLYQTFVCPPSFFYYEFLLAHFDDIFMRPPTKYIKRINFCGQKFERIHGIDLQLLNLAHSSSKLAFFGPQIDFLELQNIFFWCLKCFKSTSGHISHGIDQKNGPSSEFPSLNRPQIAQFSP